MEPLRTLFDHAQTGDPALPSALHDLYDGNLHFPIPSARPYVVANFVSTLDGVVSYKIPGHSTGSDISGSDRADHFIMGLLRASADAVMIGSRTLLDMGPDAPSTPAFTFFGEEELYKRLRVEVLHKAEYPLTVVVSGSGRLDLERAVFRAPDARALILTTGKGERVLANAGAARLPSVDVRAMETVDGKIDPKQMIKLLFAEFGVGLLLHEGGPSLFGQFTAQGIIDELFLTLAPQIAGRLPASIRPGLVEGVEFLPGIAPWFQLLSVKQHADHLYLRYRKQHNSGPHPA